MEVNPRDAADRWGIGRARRKSQGRWDKDHSHSISCGLQSSYQNFVLSLEEGIQAREYRSALPLTCVSPFFTEFLQNFCRHIYTVLELEEMKLSVRKFAIHNGLFTTFQNIGLSSSLTQRQIHRPEPIINPQRRIY